MTQIIHFGCLIGSGLTPTFPETGEGVTAVTDEVDTKTVSTKQSVPIVSQPHPSGFACHLPQSRGRSRFKPLSRRHPYRSPKLFSAFSFETRGTKEKANKKKMPIRKFRSCGSDQGSAFGIRKLLKKFDQNF